LLILSVSITIRISKKVADAIEYLAKETKSNRTAVLRQLLEKSLKDELIKLAIEKLKNKEISIWKAAKIANLSLWEFIDELKSRKVVLYDEEDLRKDIENLQKLR